MKRQIRHGDVLLIPVGEREVPKGAQKRSEAILAYGEVTGHAHRLRARGVTILQWEEKGQQYIKVTTPGSLTHEEHLASEDRIDLAVEAEDAIAEAVRVLGKQAVISDTGEKKYALPIPPGTYRVNIQRVHTPWGERRVLD